MSAVIIAIPPMPVCSIGTLTIQLPIPTVIWVLAYIGNLLIPATDNIEKISVLSKLFALAYWQKYAVKLRLRACFIPKVRCGRKQQEYHINAIENLRGK